MSFSLNRVVATAAFTGTLLAAMMACYPVDAASSSSTPTSQARLDADAQILYVTPDGNDAWSGKSLTSDDFRTDGPLATVEGARDRIRQIKAKEGGLKRPIAVLIRGGMYSSGKTIEFTPEDSGTEACPITYQAYPGELVILSGGTVLDGSWQPDDSDQSKTKCDGKIWKLDLAKATGSKRWDFNQLFVDGQRRTRARTPNKGSFLRSDGPVSKTTHHEFYFKEGDLQEWRNLNDAIAVMYHSWETSIHHIRNVDTEGLRVTLHEASPWSLGQWEKQQRYYVENVFEALDQPGEWYLDRKAGMLYYYPLPGEKMDELQVVVPQVATTLIQFAGDPDDGKFVEHLRFRGLSLQHSNAALRRLRNPGQGEIYQKAHLMAVGLRNSVIESCEVAHTGAHAIWMANGCSDNVIQRCHLHDLGGGGVYIGGGWGVQDSTPTERITVDNCFIHEGGLLFHGAHGVWIGKSSYNKVTHNEISNLDYSAISCGWSWGFQPTSANHNNLDYNHIHHLSNGEGLSDMGGIYTLGVSPGTTERYNHLHDIYNYAHVSHGSGIYPDEGSSEILIENNIVHHIHTCPVFQHYGKDNTIRNNILAFGGEGQIQRCREDLPCHYVAEGNILYADIQQMLGGVWKSGDWKVGNNVYWSTTGKPLFRDMDFETWKTKGNDVGSIVADPLFVDPENGDFRLKPNSPALKLGFKPIDTSQIGLYGDARWVNLPTQYKNRELNNIPAPVAKPKIINYGFEGEASGEPPLEGHITTCKKGSSIKVSDETAATGKQSLKFTDAAEQEQSWLPHLNYQKTCDQGKVLCSWDMLNSKEHPARFLLELRDYDTAKSLGKPYLTGPHITVDPDGKVTANGKAIGTIPLGQWVHVALNLLLGEGAPKTYQFTLTVPGQDPITAELPYTSSQLQKITWLGVCGTSNEVAEFYLDNIKLGTPEELAKTPQRRPQTTASTPKPIKPANNQSLMGHWTFDEGDGYVAEDSSGYGNHGDVWAGWATGKFGSAIFCDQKANHVIVRDNPTIHLGTSDFALEFWICPTQLKIDSKDKRRRLLSKNHYPETWMVMDITGDGRVTLEMVDDKKASCHTRLKEGLPENAWTHLAISVDRTNGKVNYYRNGELDSTHDIPASFTGSMDVNGKDLSIGSTWQPFIGLLDEVKLYKRTLSPEEIKATYEKEKNRRDSAEYELVE